MKYLLILVVLCVGVWLWRQRAAGRPSAKAAPAAPRSKKALRLPTEMVACQVCDVHLPRQEALPGSHGLYCSDSHRRQAEGQS